VPRDEVFGYTGVQFIQINTLYQVYAEKLSGSPALGGAKRLLNMPDLFNYWLTGVSKSEQTIASTTQFFNPERMTWATELLDRPGDHAAVHRNRVVHGWEQAEHHGDGDMDIKHFGGSDNQ